jgi:YlmC/YmxH family sporulation protein
METTFTELRSKEVVNALTGRILGNICDVVMDLGCNRILGFVVPGSKNFFSFFKASQEIFIPFSYVRKIGEDIILVEIAESPSKKQKKVRIFEAQKQDIANSSKTTLEQTGENKHIYPMSNGTPQTTSQTKNEDHFYQNNGVSKSLSKSIGQNDSYPATNVSLQSLNEQNIQGNQRNLYNDGFYEKNRNMQNSMTNFEEDDIYPLN